MQHKYKHKQSILDLREEYNEKIDKIVKDYDDKILDKDKDIREHKIEINALTRDKNNLEAFVLLQFEFYVQYQKIVVLK